MEDKVIVTIDREFGSGGHEVAKRVAERLGIPFYDEEIIAMAAANTGYHEEYIRDNDEKAPEISFGGVFSGIDSFQSSPFAKIQEEEFNIIRTIASEGSCVIVGRAADYILAGERHVSIFLFAPFEERVRRKQQIHNAAEPENLYDIPTVEKAVKQIDKQRRRYYEFYTDQKWGDKENYDLMLNLSYKDIPRVVKRIAPWFTV